VADAGRRHRGAHHPLFQVVLKLQAQGLGHRDTRGGPHLDHCEQHSEDGEGEPCPVGVPVLGRTGQHARGDDHTDRGDGSRQYQGAQARGPTPVNRGQELDRRHLRSPLPPHRSRSLTKRIR